MWFYFSLNYFAFGIYFRDVFWFVNHDFSQIAAKINPAGTGSSEGKLKRSLEDGPGMIHHGKNN